VSDYPFIEFRSIDELCSQIDTATSKWDTKWFRGVQKSSYELMPKIFRDDFQKKREGYIAVEFRRRARARIEQINTQFEWLCAMQHYGIPTRLLDWTESLPVALYFTFHPFDKNDPPLPTIWVLDPFQLSELAVGSDKIIPISTSKIACANADLAFCDDEENLYGKASRYPVPVAPDFIFDRLASQNGTFTLHGTDLRPLEATVPSDKRPMLLKFVASKDHLPGILQTLMLAAPSPDAVFPDLEGIRDYIV
jgi:hypothetical protein